LLLQSLLLIATLIIMGSALLTSTLVNAKTAFHQMVARKTQAAMSDATSEFTAWAQENVRTNGIAQLPVWSAKVQQRPLQSLCKPAETGGAAASPPSSCALFQRIQWNVTGHTGSISNAASNDTLLSTASNIATAQDEQRISATITVAITNASGTLTYANHSREVTARLFHAFPYLVITASRDASTDAGEIESSEGDTAGAASQYLQTASASGPVADEPATFTNTEIRTTVDCRNTANQPPSNSRQGGNNASFVQLRRYGNLSWAFEVPCAPSTQIDARTIPPNYLPPDGAVYQDRSTINASWFKGDENNSSFAR